MSDGGSTPSCCRRASRWPAACSRRRAGAQTVPGPPLQLVQPEGPSAPPLVVTLQDALERARENDAQFQSAIADAESRRARIARRRSASLLPALSHTTQYLGTQGDTASRRAAASSPTTASTCTARGRSLHQELSAKTLLRRRYRRAQAAEVLAEARLEIAQRGLAVTVTQNYYALVDRRAEVRHRATGRCSRRSAFSTPASSGSVSARSRAATS